MTFFEKTYRFAAAHYLDDYQGKCGHIHGHNYELRIRIYGATDKQEMIIESDKLNQLMQSIMDTFDHSLMIKSGGYLDQIIQQNPNSFWDNVIYFDRVPTTEAVAKALQGQIIGVLRAHEFADPANTRVSVFLKETHTIEAGVE